MIKKVKVFLCCACGYEGTITFLVDKKDIGPLFNGGEMIFDCPECGMDINDEEPCLARYAK